MAQGNVIEEYVVKLGTIVDNAGIQQILSFLDSSKMKALSLSAALAGATAGIFKFIEASTAHEFELAKLAKTQKKTLELTRAEDNAMKAMGKTMAEINKDKDLKAIYKDIVEFNKEMQLPDISGALDKVRNLEIAFTKLKSVINTATQYINAQLLINLERPIDRITGKTEGFVEWLKENMKNYAPKIATVLTDFVKGITGILEVGEKVLKWLNDLPVAIKAVGAAVLALIAIVKGGTIGRLLTLITLVGDVIHDADNYKWNQENKANPTVWYDEDGNPTIKKPKENAKPYEVPIAFPDIWEIYFGEGETSQKTEDIASRLVTKLTDLFKKVADEFARSGKIAELLDGENSIIGQIFKGLGNYFREHKEEVVELVSSLFLAISEGIKSVEGMSAQLAGYVGDIIASVFGSGDIWKDSKVKEALNGQNGIINGIIGALEFDAMGASPLVSIIGGAIGGWRTERDKALQDLWRDKYNGMSEALMPDISDLEAEFGSDPKLAKQIADNFQDSFNTTISAALEIMSSALTIAGDVSSGLIRDITTKLFTGSEVGSAVSAAFDAIGDDNPYFEAFSSGLATWIVSGNFWAGLAVNIGTLISSGKSKDEMKKAANQIFDAIEIAWFGEIDMEKSIRARKKIFKGNGLETMLKQLWGGEDGEGGLKNLLKKIFVGGDGEDSFVQQILNWLEPIGNAIVGWFETLWGKITEGLGDTLEQVWIGIYNKYLRGTLADQFAIKDPNTSKVEKDEKTGKTMFRSTTNEEIEIPEELAPYMEQIASISSLYRDPNGELRFKFTGNAENFGKTWMGVWDDQGIVNDRITDDLVKPTLAGEMSADLIQKIIRVMGQMHGYDYENVLPNGNEGTEGGGGGGGKPETKDLAKNTEEAASSMEDFTDVAGEVTDVMDDQVDAYGDLEEEMEKASDKTETFGDSIGQVETDVDSFGETTQTSGDQVAGAGVAAETAANAMIAAGEAAMGAAGAFAAAAAAASAGGGKAWGGRIGSAGHFLVGEDGPEYIIPVTKPQRAMDLINQALSEMGMGALNRASNDFGIGTSASFGTLGGSLDSLLNGLGGNTNISAPINIYVTATGSDAKEIGTAAYDAAERHLVKTLRGVVA